MSPGTVSFAFLIAFRTQYWQCRKKSSGDRSHYSHVPSEAASTPLPLGSWNAVIKKVASPLHIIQSAMRFSNTTLCIMPSTLQDIFV